jgi:acyl-CoA synthetase (AMP-forming)/AMP-acid ligase II
MIGNVEGAVALSALVRRYADERGDQEALVFVRDPQTDDTDRLTYRQLDARAALIADALAPVPSGSRVLLLYPQGVECVAAFFGCLYAGMVAVIAPLPGKYHENRRRLSSIAIDAGIGAVLTDSANLTTVREWIERDGLPGLPVLATDELGPARGAGVVLATADRATLAVLQYTSGSTTDPKGVELTHGNLLHNVCAFARAIAPESTLRICGWAPLYHDMGLIVQTLAPLALGTTAILMSPTMFVKRPYLWLKMIDVFDVPCSPAPNFGYALANQKITDEQIATLDLSRWRYACVGAEPVQASTVRDFTRRFAAAGLRPDAVSPCYGLAEATVYVSGDPGRPAVLSRVDTTAIERGELVRVRPDEPGRDLPANGAARDFDLRVVDPVTSRELPRGRVGEIWLRGPSVARGYWGNPEATEQTFGAHTSEGAGPFLRTGDLGTLVDGNLYVTGRRKDLMIINGRNLHPHDVEHAVRVAHAELDGLPSAAFSVPTSAEHLLGGEALMLVQEVRGRPSAEAARALTRSMRETISQEFGVRAAAVLLVRRSSVHRTTSGKIQRSTMRKLFLDGAIDALYADRPQARTEGRTG